MYHNKTYNHIKIICEKNNVEKKKCEKYLFNYLFFLSIHTISLSNGPSRSVNHTGAFFAVFFWYLLETSLFPVFIWNNFPHAEKKVYILLKRRLILYKMCYRNNIKRGCNHLIKLI